MHVNVKAVKIITHLIRPIKNVVKIKRIARHIFMIQNVFVPHAM